MRCIACLGLAGSFLHDRIARGVQRRLRREDGLIIRFFPGTPTGAAAALAWRADGVVAHVEDTALAETLRSWTVPVVNTSRVLADDTWPYAGPDNQAIGRSAGEHLRSQGHRRFAWVGDTTLAYAAERKIGFVSSVGQVSDSWDEEVPEPGRAVGGTADEVDRRFAEWLSALPDPCGILASRGTQAVLLCDHARILGLAIPLRLAVVSGLDEDLPSVPALTGVGTNSERWGATAAEVLLEWLATGKRPKDQLVAPEAITVRESSTFLASGDDAVRKAMAFIATNRDRPIVVDEVAAAASLSRRALERRFAERVGRSILEEIHRIHLDQASRLLAETDLPMKGVARQSGFTSEEHLRRVFLRHAGTTPGAFRSRARG